MLTTEDIETLNAARKILDTLCQACSQAGWEAPSDSTSVPRSFDYGKLHEATDTAAEAIFNVLNTARSYCNVEITNEQMHMREEAKADA